MTARVANPKPGGRPTRYRIEYCAKVVELGKVGMSKAAIASTLDVHYDTLHNWMDRHPAFFKAMGRAQRESQAWWEEKGRIHLVAGNEDAKINAALYSRSMAARFPNDWREKSEVKQDVNVTAKLTDSERAAKLSGLLDSARARGAGSPADVGSEEVDSDGGASE